VSSRTSRLRLRRRLRVRRRVVTTELRVALSD
jgi:hypothetical protein